MRCLTYWRGNLRYVVKGMVKDAILGKFRSDQDHFGKVWHEAVQWLGGGEASYYLLYLTNDERDRASRIYYALVGRGHPLHLRMIGVTE